MSHVKTVLQDQGTVTLALLTRLLLATVYARRDGQGSIRPVTSSLLGISPGIHIGCTAYNREVTLLLSILKQKTISL